MSEKESKLKNIVKKIKSAKHLEIVIAVIAVAVMIVIYFSTLSSCSKNTSETKTNVTDEDYCTRMQMQITKAVAEMCGDAPTVVISWESGIESVIAYNTTVSGNNQTSTPQLITSQGTSSPIVLKEIYPKAMGAIIICQGGDNVKTKLDIITAVSVLLNITPEKISVFSSKK